MALTLDAATTAHAQYVAALDVAPLAAPSTMPLADYQQAVYVQYVSGTNWSQSVMDSYAAFAAELLAQWDTLLSIMSVSFHDDDPTPTVNGRISYRAFVDDVRASGTLRVFRSQGKHPILDALTVEHEGRIETLNSIFRAVHDFFGHLASGGHFGWSGETRAYYSHAAMFSVSARLALFNETVAQQCYYATVGDFVPEDRAVYFDAAAFNPPLK